MLIGFEDILSAGKPELDFLECVLSHSYSMKSGVLQGSILGSLMYNILLILSANQFVTPVVSCLLKI